MFKTLAVSQCVSCHIASIVCSQKYRVQHNGGGAGIYLYHGKEKYCFVPNGTELTRFTHAGDHATATNPTFTARALCTLEIRDHHWNQKNECKSCSDESAIEGEALIANTVPEVHV